MLAPKGPQELRFHQVDERKHGVCRVGELKALLDAGGDLQAGLRDAPKKDAGFSPLTLAWVLKDFDQLPAVKALGWSAREAEELVSFRQWRCTEDARRPRRVAALARSEQRRGRPMGEENEAGAPHDVRPARVDVIHLDTSFLIKSLVRGSAEDRSLRDWLKTGEVVAMSAVAWAELLCGPLEQSHLELVSRRLV